MVCREIDAGWADVFMTNENCHIMLLLTKRVVAFVEILARRRVDREIATGDHQYNLEAAPLIHSVRLRSFRIARNH